MCHMRSHWQSQISGLSHIVGEVMEDWSKGQCDWMELVTNGVEDGQSSLLRGPGARTGQGLLVWGWPPSPDRAVLPLTWHG